MQERKTAEARRRIVKDARLRTPWTPCGRAPPARLAGYRRGCPAPVVGREQRVHGRLSAPRMRCDAGDLHALLAALVRPATSVHAQPGQHPPLLSGPADQLARPLSPYTANQPLSRSFLAAGTHLCAAALTNDNPHWIATEQPGARWH